VAVGLREFRREAIAMLAFLVLSVAVIVLFGIDKPRYAYPTEWILLLFFAAGALRLLDAGFRLLAPRLGGRAALPLLVAAVVLWLIALGLWVWYIERIPRALPLAADLLFLAVALALALTQLRGIRRERLWLTACLLLMVLVTPVAAGGIAAKQREIFQVYYANYSSYLLAHWLEENLQPLDRVVLLHQSHIRHLTDLESGRLEKFSKMEAEDAATLAVEMKAKGLTHVAYTYRYPPKNPAAAYYYRTQKIHLAEQFRDGGEVIDFEHLATLPLPKILDRSPVQVYRVLP
jgi:hypothetical protein